MKLRLPLVLFMVWLYGGDGVRWWRAQSAEGIALAELPSVWLSVVGMLLAVGVAVGVLRQSFRWWVIPALGVLVVDFGVLTFQRSPVFVEEMNLASLQQVADAARSAPIPRKPQQIQTLLNGLGPVPFFVRGERMPSWKMEMREGCTGPVTTAAKGTFIYCAAVNQQQAWITLEGNQIQIKISLAPEGGEGRGEGPFTKGT